MAASAEDMVIFRSLVVPYFVSMEERLRAEIQAQPRSIYEAMQQAVASESSHGGFMVSLREE